MARNRSSAKAAGSRFERQIADHLNAVVDDRIDRRVKTGALDKGDIGGWRYAGRRIVAELKDYGGRYLIGPWLAEVETERGNDDAHVGLIVAKRRGISDPDQQVVFMTLGDLLTLLGHDQPTNERTAA